MTPGLSVCWQYVAPANNFSVKKRNVLAKIVVKDVAVERTRILASGGLCQREEALLFRDDANDGAKCLKVTFR
jgi:hypothetical protein